MSVFKIQTKSSNQLWARTPSASPPAPQGRSPPGARSQAGPAAVGPRDPATSCLSRRSPSLFLAGGREQEWLNQDIIIFN